MSQSLDTEVAIIGAGTAGLYALREVRRAKKSFLLIDQGPLGTTCARVGCMPSKVALHAGATWQAQQHFDAFGISGANHLSIDTTKAWAEVKRQRDGFAGGAANSAKRAAGDHLLMGRAEFIDATTLKVTQADGTEITVNAKRIIIASGSRPVLPSWLEAVADRTITTDQLFELDALPERIGILGLGAIGLEMGLALARLGIKVVGADIAHTLGGIQDPELSALAIERFGKEFDFYLGESAEITPHKNGLLMKAGGKEHKIDLLLASLGRRPNLDTLNIAAAGIPTNERGQVIYDANTMQVGDLPIYIVGDINSNRTLMHEAADEGAMAGYNAAQDTPIAFQRKTSIAIAFTDPDIITVGAGWDTLQEEDILVGTALGSANGRCRILGDGSEMLKLYADANTGQLLGAAMVGVKAEHLASLIALAIDRKETAHSLMEMPWYHPTVEEMLQSALQDIARRIPQEHGLPLGLRKL
ncbi:MAG TPA: dihydrolipoyl dehydrogenase [Alcanivoracaceae bacterium]|nr:dihydrolipoyl dehydrogenase [Alcanivoracaceae bacterium]